MKNKLPIFLFLCIWFICIDKSYSTVREKRQTARQFFVGALIEEDNPGLEIAFLQGIESANKILANRSIVDNKLWDTQLVATIEKITRGNSLEAAQKGCKLLQQGIMALYGPTENPACSQVQSMCNRYSVPHLETHWGYLQARNSFSVNVHPNYKTFGLALVDFITHMEKWENLVIVYDKKDGLLKFEELFNVFEGTVIMRQWSPSEGTYHDIMNYLDNSQCNYFMVDLPYWKVRDFLIMASAFNMTTRKYSYVFTSWDVDLVNLAPFKVEGGANMTTFSVLREIDFAKNPDIATFKEKIFRSEQKRISFDIREGIPTNAALIYDALILLAYGLIDLAKTSPVFTKSMTCGQLEGWHVGLSLMNAISSVQADMVKGLAGPIVFDHEGLRSVFNLTILEVTPKGYLKRGYWTKRSGIVVTAPKYQFPKKKSLMGLSNATLRVTTLEEEPFVINIKKDDNDVPLPDPDAWTGFAIDILKRVALEQNFNFTVQIVEDGKYGSYDNKTKKWNGLIGEVIEGKADLAVAPLTITYSRERVVDFTTPFMNLGLTLVLKRPKGSKPHIFSFLSPLSPPVWGFIIGACVLVSLAMFVVARMSPYEWEPEHPCQENELKNQYSFRNSFWFCISSFMQQGTEINPKATSTRMLSGLWWFFTLIIISSYTANLAAFLTVDVNILPISSVKDLPKQESIKYGCIRGGSTFSFFNTSTLDVYKNMIEKINQDERNMMVNSTPEGIARVEKGGYVFILESSWLEYYLPRKCNLMQIGGLLDSKGYGIATRQGSPYRDIISESILKLQKSQDINLMKIEWFNKYNINESCSDKNSGSGGPVRLAVEQVGGVFLIMFVGTVTSFFISVCEFVYNTRKRRKEQGLSNADQPTMCQEIGPELKTAMRCMSSSKRAKRNYSQTSVNNGAANSSLPATNQTGHHLTTSNTDEHLPHAPDSPLIGGIHHSFTHPHFPPPYNSFLTGAADGAPEVQHLAVGTSAAPNHSESSFAHHPVQQFASMNSQRAPQPWMASSKLAQDNSQIGFERYLDELPELRMKKINC